MNKLQTIEHNDQRILLTSQLAENYGTTTDIISKNFNRNKERYQEGKHYYSLSGEAKRTFCDHTQITDGSKDDEMVNLGQFDAGLKNAAAVYLWTEKGALLHAKSLGTDKAWETYEVLVDTYFKAQDMKLQLSTLSPQLVLLINIETEQKRQQEALSATNERIDDMEEIIGLDTTAWREESRKLIVKIAHKMGGNEHIRDVHTELFKLVDQRAGVSLQTRLTNKRMRMAMEGIGKSKQDKLSRVDVISEDKKLIEIYIAILKQMSIKYGVRLPNIRIA